MSRKRKGILGLLAAILLLGGIGLYFYYPIMAMFPAETGYWEDTDIAVVNSGSSSFFLLPCEEGYIAIDAGTNADKTAQALKQLEIDPADVSHVLLTHSDSDHTAALRLFPYAQFYMSENEKQMIDGSTKRNFFSKNSLPTKPLILDDLAFLRDGDTLNLGGRTVRCIETPGHTLGSMCFLVDDAYLFTGDAFQVKTKGNFFMRSTSTDPTFSLGFPGLLIVHPFTMDEETALASLAKLRELWPEGVMVFTAHYGIHRAENLVFE